MIQNGKRVVYVICFHCLQLQRFIDGAKAEIPTTAAAGDTLDAQLTKAGVPVFHEEENTSP